MDNPLLDFIANNDPISIRLRPEYRREDGTVDPMKVIDALGESTVKYFEHWVSKPECPEDVKAMFEKVKIDIDAGRSHPAHLALGAFRSPRLIQELDKIWDVLLFLPETSEVVH